MGAAAGAMALAAARPAHGRARPVGGALSGHAQPGLCRCRAPGDVGREHATTFNNYYEFGSSKRIAAAAEKLPIRPWTIAIDGEVEKPFTVGIDDLF
jgi:methionine sulfoxide reductase catalytic subunit